MMPTQKPNSPAFKAGIASCEGNSVSGTSFIGNAGISGLHGLVFFTAIYVEKGGILESVHKG